MKLVYVFAIILFMFFSQFYVWFKLINIPDQLKLDICANIIIALFFSYLTIKTINFLKIKYNKNGK